MGCPNLSKNSPSPVAVGLSYTTILQLYDRLRRFKTTAAVTPK